MQSSPRWSSLVLLCAIAAAAVPSAQAQEFLGLQIHGFGGWYYGRSSNVQFIGAEKGGTAQTAQFALNAAATPMDRVRLLSQVNFHEHPEGSDVSLDYAFAEFDVAKGLKIRAGRAKHPWGIYGEIYDVGTARPFHHLSQAIYGPVGFTAKAYNGIGLTGSVGGGSGWGLQYDVYGGEIDAEYEESGLFALADPAGPPAVLPTKYSLRSMNKDVIGTRVQLNTPVEGLWVGTSAYRSKVNLTGLNASSAKAYIGSLEYQNAKVLLRAEMGKVDLANQIDERSSYAEAAYRLTEKWQLAARWDDLHRDLTINVPGVVLPPFLHYRLNVDHTERLLGVNYWVNPNVVVRASYSQVKGPALLYPSAMQLGTYLMTGMRPKDETNMLLLGTQFSF